MHRRSIITAAALAGMAFGLLVGDLVTGSGPASLFGTSASHDDPVTESVTDDSTVPTLPDGDDDQTSSPDPDDTSPTTAPDDDDDDQTSTTLPDDDDGDDDRTSTTLPDDDDGDDDRTSTTLPDDDDDGDGGDDEEVATTSEVRSFSASDAATITVRRTGDRLEIVSINRNEGWTQEIKADGADKVEVRFEGHDRRVEFRAEVDDGVISTRIRDEAR